MATAANRYDTTEAHKLIRDGDEVIYGGYRYAGLGKREEIKLDRKKPQIEYRTNKRPSKAHKMPAGFAQVIGKGQGRVYVSAHKTHIWLLQNGIQGHRQKSPQAAHFVL
jgi:hypothetical protein